MSKNENAESWEHSLAIRVGERIKHYRAMSGLSAQKLSDRTVQLGHEVKRATIAGMENRTRTTIPLADVLVLARALAIAPVLLIFPFESASPIQALPTETVDVWAAYDWMVGAENLGRPAAWVETEEEHRIEAGHYNSSAMLIKLRFEYERTLINIKGYSSALQSIQQEAGREDKSEDERGVFERQASEYARLLARENGYLTGLREALTSRGLKLNDRLRDDSASNFGISL
jgi:hypothetical protein